MPECIHESLIQLTQHNRIIGHIARDSTAIEAREQVPQTYRQKLNRKREKAGKPALAKQSGKNHGITNKQRAMPLAMMLKGLSRDCAVGAKTNSKGHPNYWRGYKLHLDVADGQIPVTAILTGAKVHDAKVAIPLMTMTTERVQYLYGVMDSAYDADAILKHSRELGHVPVVNPHGRRKVRRPSQLPKIFPAKPDPQLCPAKADDGGAGQCQVEGRVLRQDAASQRSRQGGGTSDVRGDRVNDRSIIKTDYIVQIRTRN